MNSIEPNNQFARFCSIMLLNNIKCVELHTQPEDLINRSEIRSWELPNGKKFLTQHWKEGFYNVYFPTQKEQVDEVYREVFDFGGIKDGLIRW